MLWSPEKNVKNNEKRQEECQSNERHKSQWSIIFTCTVILEQTEKKTRTIATVRLKVTQSENFTDTTVHYSH